MGLGMIVRPDRRTYLYPMEHSSPRDVHNGTDIRRHLDHAARVPHDEGDDVRVRTDERATARLSRSST